MRLRNDLIKAIEKDLDIYEGCYFSSIQGHKFFILERVGNKGALNKLTEIIIYQTEPNLYTIEHEGKIYKGLYKKYKLFPALKQIREQYNNNKNIYFNRELKEVK